IFDARGIDGRRCLEAASRRPGIRGAARAGSPAGRRHREGEIEQAAGALFGFHNCSAPARFRSPPLRPRTKHSRIASELTYRMKFTRTREACEGSHSKQTSFYPTRTDSSRQFIRLPTRKYRKPYVLR